MQRVLATFGLGLKIFDAYRPQMSVDHLVRWFQDHQYNKMKLIYYPDLDKADLFKQGFIAKQSAHSRASTLDVTLVSLSSENVIALDMGTHWDFFGEESWTHHIAISPEQRENRMLLQQVMTQAGFRGLKQEWWHFSLENEPFSQTYFNFPVE
ncbi:M15 family metallopeptidase [Shewanella surugensis]|uniref:M15 family metallopeptidase n=1 Tax=Shewanella surugensis TaxID=212020 RepID=A0ABT0LFF0_9GAMM|nr:M15 family metallopeptidase [Shewanella surugensis]